MKITANQLWWLAIALVYLDKLLMAAFVGADKALFDHQPWYPEGQSIDYSVLWMRLNPLWVGRFWYSVGMVFVDLAAFLVCTRLRRIPRSYLLAFAVMTAFNYNLFLEIQNVTVSMFAPLLFYSSLFFFAMPLQKLPLFWSWSIRDPHVRCLFECGNPWQGYLKWLYEVATNGPVVLVYLMAWRTSRKLDKAAAPKCSGCGKTFKSLGLNESSNICFGCRNELD